MSLYFVGTYLVDREFGGREEGGWYYDYGDLVTDPEFYSDNDLPLPQAFLNMKDAYEAENVLQNKLEHTVNVGRRPISSVLSQGQYQAKLFEGELPTHFPSTKPIYE